MERETRRVALRVAYDGTRFSGSQRQPGRRSVEGDLLEALGAVGALSDPRAGRFQAAGRTDRGVSAAGNVFALDTAFDAEALPGALNAHLRDAWVTAFAVVRPDFNARHARSRRYRYFLRGDAVEPAALEAALRLFVGAHDFTSFCRLEPGRSPNRSIDAIRVSETPPFLAVDFEAEGFLWNQVRRVVSAGLAVATGEVEAARVQDALAGKLVEDFGLAPPEPLVLIDVGYDFKFHRDGRASRVLEGRLRSRLAGVQLEEARTRLVLDAVSGS